jgi:hypothetical protein
VLAAAGGVEAVRELVGSAIECLPLQNAAKLFATTFESDRDLWPTQADLAVNLGVNKAYVQRLVSRDTPRA